ncbi:hypothetical protein HDU67_001615 [Dinochytrium kinnereticum]|nr:hypothetical protein HDU67_001615 [Dinochytrium kinnereticum]
MPLLFTILALATCALSETIKATTPVFIPYSGPGFAAGTEGAGIDRQGNIYGVNFADIAVTKPQGTVTAIGRIQPEDGATSLFANLISKNYRGKMVVNGIRFTPSGDAYIADAGNHVVLRVPKGGKGEDASIVCDFETIRTAGAGIPNDLVVAKDGTIYVSGANFEKNTGGIYKCDPKTSVVSKVYEGRRTNGIDLDPQQQWLYFTEGGDKEEWIMRINLSRGSGGSVYTFQNSTLPFGYAADLDGIRFDVQGNLYVTLNGAGAIGILDVKSSYTNLEVVKLEGKMSNPSNLEIGEKGGVPTVFVLGGNFVDGAPTVRGMVAFPAKAPGRQISFLRSN